LSEEICKPFLKYMEVETDLLLLIYGWLLFPHMLLSSMSNYCLTFMVFCRILSHFASYLYIQIVVILFFVAFAAYFFGIFRLFGM